MKLLHWILAFLATWILTIPFIADEILTLLLGNTPSEKQIIDLLRWDDFFLGISIAVIALIIVTIEQAIHKHPGLKAMHWMQVVLGFWIAIAPFALEFNYEAYTWSHFVAGGFTVLFALLQITYEK